MSDPRVVRPHGTHSINSKVTAVKSIDFTAVRVYLSDVAHDLVGLTEVGELLGVSRQRAAQLAESAGFPAPVAELASGRIWRGEDVRLWTEVRRRGGRPKTGYRIEYEGERDDKRNNRRTISLGVIWIDEPGIDGHFLRWIDRSLVTFAIQQLQSQRPPAEAELSVRRALAGLTSLQLRREIEDANFVMSAVPFERQVEHRWFQYLLSHAQSINHPIPEIRQREVLHLWIHPGAIVLANAQNAGVTHVHMECGHWVDRSVLPEKIAVFQTVAECPSCRASRRVVGLWPQR